jgi:hypothetical protein
MTSELSSDRSKTSTSYSYASINRRSVCYFRKEYVAGGMDTIQQNINVQFAFYILSKILFVQSSNSWDVTPLVLYKFAYVSEEDTDYIFRI